MDPFSYLVVLTSIVLGLGVTRLVGGLGQLMQSRKRKRTYWVQHVVGSEPSPGKRDRVVVCLSLAHV
jgi:multisubunit Na+/H+ antiporter MnhC subunit